MSNNKHVTTVKLDNVAVILSRPRLAENIGTAARAVCNMGIGKLIVVQPEQYDERVIRIVATRQAEPVVDGIEIYDDLKKALASYQYVVGTTARMGNHRGPFITPRELAEEAISISADNRIALLFGHERTGLTSEELRNCQAIVRIPTADRKASSLNLAQAVLILGYELLLAHSPQPRLPKIKTAPQEEVQAMYDNLEKTLLDIGFLPDQNSDYWLMSFKRIFNRSGLTHGDCNLLRGVCRQINWAVRTGGKVKKYEPQE